MNILWITNIVFPEAQVVLNPNFPKEKGGGWLIGCATLLKRVVGVELFVVSVTRQVKKLTQVKGDSITYYLIPYGKGNTRVNREYESFFKTINEEVKPDIVHIHGTEYSHGISYLDACGSRNVVLSIQGLMGVISRYYYGGISYLRTLSAITPVSVLLRMNIPHEAREFKHRGRIEVEMINRVNHIIGRTSWDKAHIWAINPRASYHYGGEILRESFYYEPIWEYKYCRPHSIFVSQGSYPVKGLHFVLEALPLVKRYYPDVQLRVAGVDITRGKSWKEVIKLSDYGNIIRRVIRKNKLKNNVTFTGPLDEKQIRNEYLKCNVFICPSSIENSPNSLAEAQVLGTPVLASYVGGVMDMMKGDEDHLYRYDEVEMLAKKIVEIFEEEDKISTESIRKEALKRHDPARIIQELVCVYKCISEGGQ